MTCHGRHIAFFIAVPDKYLKMADITVLGIAGSLRKGSYNRMLLKAAAELAPKGVKVETFDLEGMSPYNQDLEADMPSRVRELKAAVRAADAILFVSPEYNYSIPGVLKDAIDWGSRPPADNAWTGKPVAVMGASTGMLGTARMQYHLRQVFVFLDMKPLNKPEVMVNFAAEKFRDGRLADEKTRELVTKLLANLAAWTMKLK
jgi:chromate reductase, NAD(P)H dehydrogenase (quinone)